jgi:oxaloacetate decarboxylase alpha subunit
MGADEVVVGLVFSISSIHTDDFYARSAAALDDCADIDALYLKDPGGLLTPERLETLVPAIRSGLVRKPLKEIHSHCNTGVSPRTVLDAVDMGIGTVHCAVGPASNGTSHPSARQFVQNIRARGHTATLDLDVLTDLEGVLQDHVVAHDLPSGHPLEYDETYYRHQLPGGMVSTLLHQLGEIGRQDLLPAIKDEVVRVREDFGFPIMVTPFSQFMTTQALLNVVGGERYASLADETVLYVLGDYGTPPGPLAPALVDRAHAVARERRLSLERPEPSRRELRQAFGSGLSDEDLLMSALLSPEEVTAMRSAPIGESRTARPPSWTQPVRQVLEELRDRPQLRAFFLSAPGLRVELRRDR